MNRREALGFTLAALGAFTLFGGIGWLSAWVAGVFDRKLVETYRGIDIYYLINQGLYGFQTADGTWQCHEALESVKAILDDIFDNSVYIETYRGWEIYHLQRRGIHYAINPSTGENTTLWTSLEGLKAYIDGLPSQPEEIEEAEAGEVKTPERRLSWLRWLGLPLLALGAVLTLGQEEMER